MLSQPAEIALVVLYAVFFGGVIWRAHQKQRATRAAVEATALKLDQYQAQRQRFVRRMQESEPPAATSAQEEVHVRQ